MKHLKGLHKSPLTYFIIIVLALALELGLRGSTPLAEYLFWVMVIYFNVATFIGTYFKVNHKRVFTIKKGRRYVFHFPQIARFTKKREINFRIRKGSWYDPEIHGDHIHKIKGQSFGLLTSHHNNSERLGFSARKEPGMFDLFYYAYNEGKPIKRFIRVFREMERLNNLITHEVENEVVRVMSVSYSSDVSATTKLIIRHPYKYPEALTGFELFPYYEGKDDKPAPNDITIEFFT